MRDKVVNYFIKKIENKNIYDKTKLLEIKYGFECLYTLITKSTVILLLAFVLNKLKEFSVFCLFYIPLRSVGYGAHAKSNLHCWIFSTILLLGLPILFSYINLSISAKIILWLICFITYFIFSPADTEKKPIRSKKRKFIFKMIILTFSFIYLYLILKLNKYSNLVIASMILQAFLISPVGYILMGQKVRFCLNDIFKLK